MIEEVRWLREQLNLTIIDAANHEAEANDLLEKVIKLGEELNQVETACDQLKEVLRNLREPNEFVLRAAVRGYSGDMEDALRCAVAAAEDLARMNEGLRKIGRKNSRYFASSAEGLTDRVMEAVQGPDTDEPLPLMAQAMEEMMESAFKTINEKAKLRYPEG